MIIQGIRDDKPVAIPVDETGRLLVNTNAISNQPISGTVAISEITAPVVLQDSPPDTQMIPVVVGSPVVYVIPNRRSLTIRAAPGVGGTMLVEYRISPTGDFVAWPAGTVSSATIYNLNGPVEALRFTTAVANGVVEVAQ